MIFSYSLFGKGQIINTVYKLLWSLFIIFYKLYVLSWMYVGNSLASNIGIQCWTNIKKLQSAPSVTILSRANNRDLNANGTMVEVVAP